MTTQHLTTFDDVLIKVGGLGPLAKLAGRSKPQVCMWKRAGQFPAWMFDRLEGELARRNATVSRAVFRFEPPRGRIKRPEVTA